MDLFGSVTTESSGTQQVRGGVDMKSRGPHLPAEDPEDGTGVWLLSAGAIDPCFWVVWKLHECSPLTRMREASEELP